MKEINKKIDRKQYPVPDSIGGGVINACCERCAVAAVVMATQKYLDRVILHGPITLDKLMQIENKLNSDYQLDHFSVLDNGTFLDFILSQPDIKKVS